MNWILLLPPPLSSDPDNPQKLGTCTNSSNADKKSSKDDDDLMNPDRVNATSKCNNSVRMHQMMTYSSLTIFNQHSMPYRTVEANL